MNDIYCFVNKCADGDNFWYIARALEIHMSANGRTAKEASVNLAKSLIGHIQKSHENRIDPFDTNAGVLERLTEYCARTGKNINQLPCWDVRMESGMILNVYDISE